MTDLTAGYTYLGDFRNHWDHVQVGDRFGFAGSYRGPWEVVRVDATSVWYLKLLVSTTQVYSATRVMLDVTYSFWRRTQSVPVGLPVY